MEKNSNDISDVVYHPKILCSHTMNIEIEFEEQKPLCFRSDCQLSVRYHGQEPKELALLLLDQSDSIRITVEFDQILCVARKGPRVLVVTRESDQQGMAADQFVEEVDFFEDQQEEGDLEQQVKAEAQKEKNSKRKQLYQELQLLVQWMMTGVDPQTGTRSMGSLSGKDICICEKVQISLEVTQNSEQSLYEFLSRELDSFQKLKSLESSSQGNCTSNHNSELLGLLSHGIDQEEHDEDQCEEDREIRKWMHENSIHEEDFDLGTEMRPQQ